MSDSIYATQVVLSIFQSTKIRATCAFTTGKFYWWNSVMITTTLHSIISSQSVVAQKYDLQNVNYRYVFYEQFNKKSLK
jgi:hypothetical protein